MLAKRIIPCLDVKGGAVVKGVNFRGLREMGDPVEMGAWYGLQGADELVYLDISASSEGRNAFTDLVRRISEKIDIPFTVGGGVSTLADASRLLDAGADKVTVNTAAVLRPDLVGEIASAYGSQFVVVAIDAMFSTDEGRWTVTTHGGMKQSSRELFSWAHEVQEMGAGEILFTSMDHDGTRKGYAVKEYAALSGMLSIPVIASGGAGNIGHFVEVLSEGRADAALAAGVFHSGEISIPGLKACLKEAGIPVRI